MSVIISPPPTHLILSPSFHVHLRKLAMVLTQIKNNNNGSCNHGNRKLTMVLLLKIIQRSIKIIFFVVIKTNLSQQQPLKLKCFV